MTQIGAHVSPDLLNQLVKTLQPMTAMFGSLSVAVRESTVGNFKIEVDGDRPKILWIRWYYTTATTIGDPQLADTPYMDIDGTLVVDDLHDPSFIYTTGDIGLPTGTRWVQAVAWGLYANSATLVHNSGKHEFLLPTTTTSTSTSTSTSSSTTESTSTSSSTTESTSTSSSTTESTSTSSSTTGSTSTSSSTTETSTTTGSTSSTTGSTSSTTTDTSSSTTDTSTSSTTEAPSTTGGAPGLVTWTWKETKAGAAWVLTSPKPKGVSPQPPDFNGKKVGDTAHTQMP